MIMLVERVLVLNVRLVLMLKGEELTSEDLRLGKIKLRLLRTSHIFKKQ